ncbi:MAG: acyloxyacyl hydrolase [Fimbriimonadales bacterium]
MLFATPLLQIGAAALIAYQGPRLRSTTVELSTAHSYKVLGTSQIRLGTAAGIEWGRRSRALSLQGHPGILAQETAYLRLMRSFRGDEGFNALVAGVGSRWIGGGKHLKNIYFEAGTGVSISDGVSLDVNSHFSFVSFVGAGFYFSSAPRANRAGLRWIHVSNANLDPPNRGLNQFEVVVGVRY